MIVWFFFFDMDEIDFSREKSVLLSSSSSDSSENCEVCGSYHTPLNSPPKSAEDEGIFLTPLNESPVKEPENLIMYTSHVRLNNSTSSLSDISCDHHLIPDQKIQHPKQDSYFLLPPPHSSSRKSTSSNNKPPVSESLHSSPMRGNDDSEERYSVQFDEGKNPEKIQSSTVRIQLFPKKPTGNSLEPYPYLQLHSFRPIGASGDDDGTECKEIFDADEEEEEEPEQETEHVLKKYTKSPEFLQLKDTVNADEINDKVNEVKKMLQSYPPPVVEPSPLKDIINTPKMKNSLGNNSVMTDRKHDQLMNQTRKPLCYSNALSISTPENLYGTVRETGSKRSKGSSNLFSHHRKSSLDSLSTDTENRKNSLEEFYNVRYKCPFFKNDEGGNFYVSKAYISPDKNLIGKFSVEIPDVVADDDDENVGKWEKNANAAAENYKMEESNSSNKNLNVINSSSSDIKEKSSSLKNLLNFDSVPMKDVNSSGKSSESSYDLSKLKKPSSRLVDLLEYCKKNPKGKPCVVSPSKPFSYTALSPEEITPDNSFKNLPANFDRLHDSRDDFKIPLSSVPFTPVTSRERMKNFGCCVKQKKDSSFMPLKNDIEYENEGGGGEEDEDGDNEDVSCSQSVKKIFSSEHKGNHSWMKSKGKGGGGSDKEGGKRKMKQAKSSSTDDEKNKQKVYRLDQSYCDVLNQLHDDMLLKQRSKGPKKEIGRMCRSDPPHANTSKDGMKFPGGEETKTIFCDTRKNSGIESYYDFNVKSEPDPFAEYLEFEREPYSKRPVVVVAAADPPKEKGKLERMESFYDNKISNGGVKLERLESLYENHNKKTSKSEEKFCPVESHPVKPEILLGVPYFPDRESGEEKNNLPKPLMTYLPSEWWPVVDAPKSDLAWNQNHTFEVRFFLIGKSKGRRTKKKNLRRRKLPHPRPF